MTKIGVWGTGNMGRAALRSIQGNAHFELGAIVVSNPDKVGLTCVDLCGIGAPGGPAAVLPDDFDPTTVDAVAYTASGDIRPDEAVADIASLLRLGVHVVTPALYGMYHPASADPATRDILNEACQVGQSSLFVSGIDPGWGNDILPAILSGLCSEIELIRCQEIFDYSTYDQPDSVRFLVGMGQPMDEMPPMVTPGIPTMVWGPSVRLIGDALGVEFDDIVETLERKPLDQTVTNQLGVFEQGTQGALRFEIQGHLDGRPVVIVEHVTRIDPECAPEWPQPTSGAGTHRVIVEGSPRLEVSVEAESEGGNRAAGGNETAANRLVNAIPWLQSATPGIHDALAVPLSFGRGKLRGLGAPA